MSEFGSIFKSTVSGKTEENLKHLDRSNAAEMQTVHLLNISIVFCCRTNLHAIFSFSVFHIVHYSLNMCILISCFRFLNL